MEERPSARFSAAAVCMGPYKDGSFFFVGGCNKNLEPLDDIYYLHTGLLLRPFGFTPVLQYLYLMFCIWLYNVSVPNFLCLWLTEGGCDAQIDHNPGRLSLRKQMKLICQGQKLAVARPNIDQGMLIWIEIRLGTK